jgi:hypothetical protein
MIKRLFPIALAILFQVASLYAQEKWKFQMVVGNNDFGPINTIMYEELDQSGLLVGFYSSLDADKRIFGNLASPIIRLAKKFPKKGILLQIKDITLIDKMDGFDSISATFIMPMLGVNSFKGIRLKDSISGQFLSKEYGVPVYLTGKSTNQNEQLDYSEFPKAIFDTTQKYIFDPGYLNSRKWRKFRKKIEKFSFKAKDDIELFFAFNIYSQKLPFSHYQLVLNPPPSHQIETIDNEPVKTRNNVFFKQIDKQTALLEVKSFSGGAFEMDSVMSIVCERNFENLIIDLRNNGGGGINSADALGGYLINEQTEIGYFVTNKWYAHHGKHNLNFDILPVSTATSTDKFLEELMTAEGFKSVTNPGDQYFNGNTYVLISGKTASTCEPLVYSLKTNKISTIVGENTAGAMLAARPVHIQNNLYLFMAIADFYTPDTKTRLDKIGVSPDIEVPEKEALEYVKKLIANKSNE